MPSVSPWLKSYKEIFNDYPRPEKTAQRFLPALGENRPGSHPAALQVCDDRRRRRSRAWSQHVARLCRKHRGDLRAGLYPQVRLQKAQRRPGGLPGDGVGRLMVGRRRRIRHPETRQLEIYPDDPAAGSDHPRSLRGWPGPTAQEKAHPGDRAPAPGRVRRGPRDPDDARGPLQHRTGHDRAHARICRPARLPRTRQAPRDLPGRSPPGAAGEVEYDFAASGGGVISVMGGFLRAMFAKTVK